MAPPKRKPSGKPGSTTTGRVTPKGAKATGLPRAAAPPPIDDDRHAHHSRQPSSRYTPPTPKELKISPPWVPVLMFTLLGAGALMIILNYLELLPSATSNWYLIGGLGLILAGIITATQYR
jgi:Cell division protein CrgA